MNNSEYVSEKWFLIITNYKKDGKLGILAHARNSSTKEVGDFMSSMSTWSMQRIPEQPEVYIKTLSPLQKPNKQKHRTNSEVFT